MILRINLWTDVAETVHDSLSKLEIPDCFVRERKYRQPKEKVGIYEFKKETSVSFFQLYSDCLQIYNFFILHMCYNYD